MYTDHALEVYRHTCTRNYTEFSYVNQYKFPLLTKHLVLSVIDLSPKG